jgi:hypothetical protein
MTYPALPCRRSLQSQLFKKVLFSDFLMSTTKNLKTEFRFLKWTKVGAMKGWTQAQVISQPKQKNRSFEGANASGILILQKL